MTYLFVNQYKSCLKPFAHVHDEELDKKSYAKRAARQVLRLNDHKDDVELDERRV